ncbi:hypothetical protein JSY36_03250 [Bacillus sp. H-16]|uniref:hypothetical protein n=1 Tax=Alteribacter salitolerans TaxID=2912333 RepID=UPI0019643213|nr:hypothetical protein [Alteribacter salitolerans]MBM7094764.1 hypothetical protein [Alteribacter salitolerans]
MKKSRFAIIVFVFLLILPTIAIAEAGGDPGDEHELLVVLVPGLSFDEVRWLIDHGEKTRLWETGGLGAVNVKGEGNYSYLNHAVTMGAGERAAGIAGWNGFLHAELVDQTPVEELVLQWTGESRERPLYHPFFSQLVKKNEAGLRQGHVGRFGTMLADTGVKRHVAGHSDTRTEKQRYGSLLLIDEEGGAGTYSPGGIQADTESPSGMRHNRDELMEEIKKNSGKKSFTVVEWGDVHRLFKERTAMTDRHFTARYEKTMLELEAFIHTVVGDTKKEVWLLSPGVNDRALEKQDQLAPLWVWKTDRSAVWTWKSDTTRREQLMGSVDLVPTWLTALGLEAGPEWTGYPLSFEQSIPGKPADFLERHEAMTAVFAKRGPVLSGYITALVTVLVGVSLVLWIKPFSVVWRRAARIVLTSAVSSPLWFLLTGPLVPHVSTAGYVLLMVIATAAGAVVVDKMTRHSVSVICGLFFLAATWDLLNGASLIKQSFLGYDPIIGARYYGIGNEFAGVYIVSGWLMLTPFFTGGKKRPVVRHTALIAVLTGMLLFLATSSLGANAGASLAAGVMIGFIVYKLFFAFVSWKRLAVFLPAGAVALLGVLYVLQLNQPASHIHSAFSLLFQGDVEAIGRIVLRKLEMNWKIFRISHWTQLFVTTYLLIGIYMWRGKKAVWSHERNVIVQGCIIASLALLFLNDSGIVAAATSMFVTLCASYAWLLDDGKKKQTG